jgi:hypothetical protein
VSASPTETVERDLIRETTQPNPNVTGFADSIEVVLHNYSSTLSESFTIGGTVSFDTSDEGSASINATPCSLTFPAGDFSCSGTIAPGQSLTLLGLAFSGPSSATGSLSITTAQYADPNVSNDSVSFSVNQTS